MQKRRLGQYVQLILLAVVLISSGIGSVALATTSSSNNYQVTETQFGVGTSQENCSGQYCAKTSIGNISGGKSASSSHSAQFGPVVEGEPLLEVIVEPGVSDLGDLSTETTATKTMTVQVRNYLSSGYIVQIIGDTPTYNGHALKHPTSPTASKPGTEQFAINAAANTTPSVGAAALQVPSAQISFGVVGDNYRVPNLFQYISGDMVARSTTESGRTDYTISMIVNISNSTPAGHYSGDFSAVVIPVY